MNCPKISIITPSYNQGQFIEETIKSVLGQEGDFYVEYIIMDGGSQDGSVEIIKKYERLLAQDKWPVKCRGIRYRWMSEKDKGQADAINKGFKLSTGEILAWLNSDDTYTPGAIKKAVGVFSSDPGLKMVYGRVYYTDSSGNITGEAHTEPFNYQRLAALTYICQPSAFFKKDACFEAGGIDTDLHYTMDYDLWIRLAQRYKIQYIPEVLSTYRLHKGSKTISEAQILDFLQETLKTSRKYYHRAPINRLYGYFYNRMLTTLPAPLKRVRAAVVITALMVTVKEYLKLNKKIYPQDVELITAGNIKKLMSGSDGRPKD